MGKKSKSRDKNGEFVSVNLHPSDVDKILNELLMINQDEIEKEMENVNLLNFCAAGLDGALPLWRVSQDCVEKREERKMKKMLNGLSRILGGRRQK